MGWGDLPFCVSVWIIYWDSDALIHRRCHLEISYLSKNLGRGLHVMTSS
jgi:hypothetical protein